VKRYLVPLSRQIIVQENDYVKAGSPLSDGAITPSDILNILGPTKVQEYIVNEVQEVYRMQGVKINDKHFEVIVRQMMNKVKIEDPGDTRFFEDQVVDKWEFMDVNDECTTRWSSPTRAIRHRCSPGRSFRCVSCAMRIRASSAATSSRCRCATSCPRLRPRCCRVSPAPHSRLRASSRRLRSRRRPRC